MTDQSRLVDLYCPVCQVFRAVPPGTRQCGHCCEAILLLVRPTDGPVELRKENTRLRKAVQAAAPVVRRMVGKSPPWLALDASIWVEEYADLIKEKDDG